LRWIAQSAGSNFQEQLPTTLVQKPAKEQAALLRSAWEAEKEELVKNGRTRMLERAKTLYTVLCQEGLPDCNESFAKPALAYIGRSIKVFLITSVGFSLTLIVVAKCKNPLLVYNTKGVSASIE
jgi:hypothetical protein